MPHGVPFAPVNCSGAALSTQSPAICGAVGSPVTVKVTVSVICPPTPLQLGEAQLTGITSVATYPEPFGVAVSAGRQEPGSVQCSTVHGPVPSQGPVSAHV